MLLTKDDSCSTCGVSNLKNNPTYFILFAYEVSQIFRVLEHIGLKKKTENIGQLDIVHTQSV